MTYQDFIVFLVSLIYFFYLLQSCQHLGCEYPTLVGLEFPIDVSGLEVKPLGLHPMFLESCLIPDWKLGDLFQSVDFKW